MTMSASGSGSGWFGRRRGGYGVPRADTFSESMPSRLATSTFEVSGQLTWLDDGRGQRAVADPGQLAREHIRGFVLRTLSAASVTQKAALEAELNERLLRSVRIDNTGVCVTWAAVALSVSPESLEAAELEDALRQDRAARHRKQEAELAELKYLRDNILTDPAMARSYWFKHHGALGPLLDSQFEEVAERLSGGSAAGRNLALADMIGRFLDELRAEDKEYLLGQLAHVFSSFDRSDLAGELSGHQETRAEARLQPGW